MTVFRSTLYQYRFFMFGGFVIMTLMALVHVLIWPEIRNILQEIVNMSLESKFFKRTILLISEKKSGEKFQAYTGLRWGLIFLNISAMLTGVLAGMGLIAGEEERGNLALLLSRPISRSRLVIEKFSAACVAIFLLLAVPTMLIYPFSKMVDETIMPLRLCGSALLFTAHACLFAALALFFSVRCNRSLTAGGWAFVLIAIFFSMAAFDFGEAWSPFNYSGFWVIQGQFAANNQPLSIIFQPRTLLADGLLIVIIVFWSCVHFERRSW